MQPLYILLIVAGYYLVLIVISLFTGRRSDNQTFFLGNRRSPWGVVAIGMVGASLSGVTFVSVPGYVTSVNFTYLQMVAGFFLGYIVIAIILLPLYYRLNLTSIYSYLNQRFGFWSYRSGALLFMAGKVVASAARLYLMAGVLQLAVFDALGIPFAITVSGVIAMIWLYTFRGGIKTIIWTDVLQTLLMISSVGLTLFFIGKELNLNPASVVQLIKESDYSQVFVWNDWQSSQHFVKQFLSGAFVTIAMTGLDQDMMQKNLSCRSLRDAQKNVLSYGLAFLPVNLLFLSLGVLLVTYMQQMGIAMPARADDIFPLVATGGYLPPVVGVLFFLGLMAAAYSSADSAMTSLTTSFSVDILNIERFPAGKSKKIRVWVHLGFAILLGLVIIVFRVLNADSIISAIYTLVGYTYGPLLGLYAFGLFTKLKVNDRMVPWIAVLSPALIGLFDYNAQAWFGFELGFEKLILNGAITFLALWVTSGREFGR